LRTLLRLVAVVEPVKVLALVLLVVLAAEETTGTTLVGLQLKGPLVAD
jgi:hypothetical protein